MVSLWTCPSLASSWLRPNKCWPVPVARSREDHTPSSRRRLGWVWEVFWERAFGEGISWQRSAVQGGEGGHSTAFATGHSELWEGWPAEFSKSEDSLWPSLYFSSCYTSQPLVCSALSSPTNRFQWQERPRPRRRRSCPPNRHLRCWG